MRKIKDRGAYYALWFLVNVTAALFSWLMSIINV